MDALDVRPEAAEEPEARPSGGRPGLRPYWGVAALVLLLFAVYDLFSVLQHRALKTSYDSMIFYQALQGYSHFHAPVSQVKGVHDWGDPHFSILGDHWSPIWMVLAPFFRLWPDMGLLFAAQALVVALGAIPVWVFGRRLFGTAGGYVAAVVYGLSWGVQTLLEFDVHEYMFAVPLIAWAIERIQARRFGQAALVAGALCLVKEDLTLTVAMFGVVIAIKGARRIGAATVVFGIAMFVLETRVFIPALSNGHGFEYASEGIGALGPTVPDALWFVVHHPLRTLQLLVSPAVKWHTTLLTFAPGLGLTLLSPIALLLLPQLLVRMIGTNVHWWRTDHQYSSVVMPIVLLAAFDGLHRLQRRIPEARRRQVVRGTLAAVVAVAVGLCVYFPFKRLFLPHVWELSALQKDAYAAIDAVPRNVVVEADARLGPHLLRHDTVWMLDATPRWAPYVVMETDRPEWPFFTVAEAQAREQLLLAHGYTVAWERHNFVILRRG